MLAGVTHANSNLSAIRDYEPHELNKLRCLVIFVADRGLSLRSGLQKPTITAC
jgi:hypothetical protein